MKRGVVSHPALLSIALLPFVVDAQGQSYRRVAVEELDVALAAEKEGNFEMAAAGNNVRLVAGVILRLTRHFAEIAPDGPPLFVDQRDYFDAYLRATGLDSADAPVLVLMARKHRQNMLIDYRKYSVIDSVMTRDHPLQALNVKLVWSDSTNGARQYEYLDKSSMPHLRVINRRIITYRLLEYDDYVLFDEISGLRGRPTTGLLGMFFALIGTARVTQSRIAISDDGLQVAVVRVRKGLIKKTGTVTVDIDGNGQKGVPKGRSDLMAIERRLKEPVRVSYHRYSL